MQHFLCYCHDGLFGWLQTILPQVPISVSLGQGSSNSEQTSQSSVFILTEAVPAMIFWHNLIQVFDVWFGVRIGVRGFQKASETQNKQKSDWKLCPGTKCTAGPAAEHVLAGTRHKRRNDKWDLRKNILLYDHKTRCTVTVATTAGEEEVR